MTSHDVSNLRTFAVGCLLTAALIVIAMLRKRRRDLGEWPQDWSPVAFGMIGMLITCGPVLVIGGFAAVILRSLLRWLVGG